MTDGIDISRWNPEPINYKGFAFCFVQISHGLSAEPMAAEHVAAATKAGVPVMGYHFLEAGGSGVEQAKVAVAEAAKLGLAKMPLALDAEVVGTAPFVRPFIAEAKKTFPSVGLYSYINWIDDAGGGYMTADWGWIAHPGTFILPKGWTDKQTYFWQFGAVGGIDRDQWRKTVPELEAFLTSGKKKPPVVVPPKAPRRSLAQRIRALLRHPHKHPGRLRLLIRRFLHAFGRG